MARVSLADDMAVLSKVMYHMPRFWAKLPAWWNILFMAVAEETSQEEMSPLKEEAR